MLQPFRVHTPPDFKRDVRRLTRRNQKVLAIYEGFLPILREDPYNRSRRYDIVKLEGVRPGEGQWRIRKGNYRLRYDIFHQDVVLYSFRDRKDVY